MDKATLYKVSSELAKKFDYNPDILLELAAMLAEEVNYHEVARKIREE